MDLQNQHNDVKRALGETVLLSDGRYGFVISELSEPDKWKCHVCSRVISTERAMLMHLSHPIHMSRLRVPHHPPEHFSKIANSRNEGAIRRKSPDSSRFTERGKGKENDGERDKFAKNDANNKEDTWSNTVRPGEPIPPGMEDIVESKCQIQESLDNYTSGPLIGIEYIVELVSSEGVGEPKYICLLCEKKGDPRSVMVHLTSYNHALRYISCFFRTAGNVINLITKTRENRKGVGMAVNKIAEQIERHYGRLKPTVAITETFAQQKYEILRQIDEKEHFRETPSTTFVEHCTAEKIKEYSKIAQDEMLSSIKNRKPDSSEEINRMAEKNDIPKAEQPKKLMDDIKDLQHTDKFSGKLSFSIGKPERSLGRNKAPEQSIQQPPVDKDDDEVIFVPSNNDPIEVRSMSSISSASEESRSLKYQDRMRSPFRHRSRSRSRGRGRPRSPLRRRGRSGERRRSPPYRRGDRYRSRSRSRSRSRYYREAPAYSRGLKDDIDRSRPYPRPKRSLSREKDRERARYEPRLRSESDRYRRSYSSDRNSRKRLPSPPPKRHDRISPAKARHDKSPEIKKKKAGSDFKSKMEIYRSKLHELEVEMDNKLKYYRERPEKHPQYSEEWKNFWNKRYKEIQLSGKDPNTYDFKPEWIIFWDERMKQLHEEELISKKDELKILLPEDDKGPSNDLQDISPPTPESQKDVTVDDIRNTWKALTGSDIKSPAKPKSVSPERNSPRPSSPWELESRSGYSKQGKGKHRWDASPPIIHCLRMLSVLEQQLGSLGPKALELLSKALSLEKTKTNESMTLLHDEEIHIFFETIKEKIRGQLLAGIVVRYLVNSCRSVINTIESMLAAYPAKPKQPVPVAPPAIIQPEPVKVAGVGLVNKMAVAQQIAEILVAQGRTDVSQQELEELINAVVGIATSSNTNVNQSSAAFISQLNLQKSTANSHINELLSNLIASAQKSLVPPSIIPVEKFPEVVDPNPIPNVQSSLFQHSTSTAPTKSMLSPLDIVDSAKVEPIIKNVPVRDFTPEKEVEKDNKSVSDDDLKERLIKFKTLSRDEQQNLIALLKDLESKEPQRVEKLRKYVALGLTQQASDTNLKPDNMLMDGMKDTGRLSPFSSRTGVTNPAPEEKKASIVSKSYVIDSDHDDDDDDYSVEDVYKSVSEKLKKKEDERKTEQRLNLSLDILDENSSSRHSFSNPVKPSLSPALYPPGNTYNHDSRMPFAAKPNLQPSKSDYTYSVADTSITQPSESYIPSLERNYGDNSNYKLGGQWGGGDSSAMPNDWSANKPWPQPGGNPDSFNAQPVGPPMYPPGPYDGQAYGAPQAAPYYGVQDPNYMGGCPPVDKPYPPYNNQPYPPYTNQAPYDYQKPYNSYRQY